MGLYDSLGNVKRKASFLRTAGVALRSAGFVTSVFFAMLFSVYGGMSLEVQLPPISQVLNLEKPFAGLALVLSMLSALVALAFSLVVLAFSTLYALLAVTISIPLALRSHAMLPALLSLPLIGLASLWGRLWAGPGQAADAGARAEP